MSFGMIFSIILIIIFIFFAFSVIKKFVNTGDDALVKKFSKDLQGDINNIWGSSKALQSITYNVPNKIKKICFVDFSSESLGENSNIYNELQLTYYEFENLFFYPTNSIEDLQAKTLEHLDVATSTQDANPLCFENINGKVSLTLQKNYKDTLVKITK